MQNQDEDWEAEDVDDDDDDNIDDYLDISDEDDAFQKKPRGRQRGKVGDGIKSARDLKSFASSNRRRRGIISYEDDESSAKDSENDSDEDFSSRTRRGANLRKKSGSQSTSTYISGRSREIRTSSRSIRKVSYVESEESEELDEAKKKKSQKVCVVVKCILL